MPNPRSTANIGGHPIHPMLVPFPIACFVGALFTDIGYWSSGNAAWFTASQWLLAVGVITALTAAVFGLTDFLGDARIRSFQVAWWHMAGNVAIVGLEAVNWYARHANGPEIILPTGITLSIIGFVALLVTGWLGGELAYVRRVGVSDELLTEAERTYEAEHRRHAA